MGRQPGLGAASFGRRTPRDGCQLRAVHRGLCASLEPWGQFGLWVKVPLRAALSPSPVLGNHCSWFFCVWL